MVVGTPLAPDACPLPQNMPQPCPIPYALQRDRATVREHLCWTTPEGHLARVACHLGHVPSPATRKQLCLMRCARIPEPLPTTAQCPWNCHKTTSHAQQLVALLACNVVGKLHSCTVHIVVTHSTQRSAQRIVSSLRCTPSHVQHVLVQTCNDARCRISTVPCAPRRRPSQQPDTPQLRPSSPAGSIIFHNQQSYNGSTLLRTVQDCATQEPLQDWHPLPACNVHCCVVPAPNRHVSTDTCQSLR